jgi:hypothetical protein
MPTNEIDLLILVKHKALKEKSLAIKSLQGMHCSYYLR